MAQGYGLLNFKKFTFMSAAEEDFADLQTALFPTAMRF
jgi:hypothetical protein